MSISEEAPGRSSEADVDGGPAPRVAIGLPVRNGMPFLVEAVESLQRQTYGNLSILISDNASTDGTEDHCRAVAAADSRVTYRRLDNNIGASRNFNDVFRSTGGRYFGWAAHDDRFHPLFVERCVDALERSPFSAMAVPSLQFVDERGGLGAVVSTGADLASPRLALRLRCFLDRHEWFMLYGIARRGALERTGLFPVDFGADVILLWEILLGGSIAVVDEVLFEYRRYDDKRVDAVLAGLVGRETTQVPPLMHLRLWRRLWDVAGSAGTGEARRHARLALLRWLPSGHFRELIFNDLRSETVGAVEGHGRLHAALAAGAMLGVRPSRALRAWSRPEVRSALARRWRGAAR